MLKNIFFINMFIQFEIYCIVIWNQDIFIHQYIPILEAQELVSSFLGYRRDS